MCLSSGELTFSHLFIYVLIMSPFLHLLLQIAPSNCAISSADVCFRCWFRSLASQCWSKMLQLGNGERSTRESSNTHLQSRFLFSLRVRDFITSSWRPRTTSSPILINVLTFRLQTSLLRQRTSLFKSHFSYMQGHLETKQRSRIAAQHRTQSTKKPQDNKY